MSMHIFISLLVVYNNYLYYFGVQSQCNFSFKCIVYCILPSRYLYWTTGSQLRRSSLTGQNVETVFSVSCAYALFLNTKLYWTERCTAQESVRSLDLSTLQESVIVESSDVDAYFGVAVYEDVVYWTGNARVYSAPVTGGGSITELLYISSYGGAQFRGITVVHPDLQPDSVNIISPHASSTSSPLVTMTPSISPSLTSSLLLPTPSPLLHTHMYVSSDDGTLVSTTIII